MYFVNKFCFLCLSDNVKLRDVFHCDEKGEKYFNKLTSSLVDMDFSDMQEHFLICKNCCKTLNVVHNFWQKCSKSKDILQNYISHLQSASKIRGEVKIYLSDIQKELENQLKKPDFEEINNVEYLEDSSEEDTCKTENSENSANGDCDSDKPEDCTVIVDKIKNRTSNTFEEIVIKIEWNNQNEDIEDKIPQTKTEPDYEDNNNEMSTEQEEEEEEDLKEEGEIVGGESTNSTLENIHTTTVVPGQTKPKHNLKGLICPKFAQNGSKYYACPICTKPYLSHTGVRDHLIKHKGPFECKTCFKVFRTQGNLNKHEEVHKVRLKCEKCGKVFSDEKMYEKHAQAHSKLRKNQCTYCGNLFTRLSDLNKHILLHTGDKKYQCAICKKAFTRKDVLNIHLRTHTLQKPFQCEVCSRYFRNRGNLTKHSLTHSGLRPYECDICHRSYRQKTHLSVHRTSHAVDRKFNCRYCRSKFAENEELEMHMTKHETSKI